MEDVVLNLLISAVWDGIKYSGKELKKYLSKRLEDDDVQIEVTDELILELEKIKNNIVNLAKDFETFKKIFLALSDDILKLINQASIHDSISNKNVKDSIIVNGNSNTIKVELNGENKKLKKKELKKGDFLYFGRYPQSVIDSDIKSQIRPYKDGMYIYNDLKYISTICHPYKKGYRYWNGNSIIKNQEEFFQIEPIAWRILDIKDDVAFIISEKILDCTIFNAHYIEQGNRWMHTDKKVPKGTVANNWMYSDIRHWLNNDFYSNAFNLKEKKQIIKTEVSINDSQEYFGDSYENYNWLSQANVYDKVFFLSVKEASNIQYGFNDDYEDEDVNLVAELTDYAIARGCQPSNLEDRTGWWWLRTPANPESRLQDEAVIDSQRRVCDVMENGAICTRGSVVRGNPDDYCDGSANGVRPVMKIKVESF